MVPLYASKKSAFYSEIPLEGNTTIFFIGPTGVLIGISLLPPLTSYLFVCMVPASYNTVIVSTYVVWSYLTFYSEGGAGQKPIQKTSRSWRLPSLPPIRVNHRGCQEALCSPLPFSSPDELVHSSHDEEYSSHDKETLIFVSYGALCVRGTSEIYWFALN